MKIWKGKCLINISCEECGEKLKEGIDDRYSLIPGYSLRGWLICENCYNKLIGQLNINKK